MEEFNPFKHQENEDGALAKPEVEETPVATPASALVTAEEPKEPEWNVFDEMDRDERDAVGSIFNQDPNTSAEARKASRLFGVPISFATDNLTTIQESEKRREFADKLRGRLATINWANENTDMANALQSNPDPMLQLDDLFHDRQVEQDGGEGADAFTLMKEFIENSSAGLEVGYNQSEMGSLGYDVMLGERSYEGAKGEIDQYKAVIQKGEEGHSGFAYEAAKVLGMAPTILKEGANGAGAVVAGATALGLFGSNPYTTVGAGATAAAAGLYGSWTATNAIEAGLSYLDNKEAGVSDSANRIASSLVGSANATIEAVGLGAMGKLTKPVAKAVMQKVMGKEVDALVGMTMSGALVNSAKLYGTGVATEVLTETFQETNNIIAEEILKSIGEGDDLTPATAEEIANRLGDIAVKTAQATALLGFFPGTVTLYGNMAKVSASKQTKRFFDGMTKQTQSAQGKQAEAKDGEQAEAKPTQPVAEDALHSFIESQGRDSGKTTVYIDAADLDDTLKQAKVSREELRAVIAPTMSPEAFEAEMTDKVQNGGDIEIPVADYATKIAGTPLGEQLNNHARLAPEALSYSDGVKLARAVQKMREDFVRSTFDNEGQAERFIRSVETSEQGKARSEIEEQLFQELKAATPDLDEAGLRKQAQFGALVTSGLFRRANLPVNKWKDRAPRLPSLAKEEVTEDAKKEEAYLQAKKKDADGVVNWLKWEPIKTKDGKIPGVPEWVTSRRQHLKMRKLLRQFVFEGESGRFWYEDTARAVMKFVRGNIKNADKFCQLLAIYSPQTGIGPNAGFAVKAYNHWANGEPAETLHVKTSAMDKKAIDVLYNDKPWAGRKTNSFYSNIMYDIVMQDPEGAKKAGIDVDDVLSGRATIDLWMLRAFGYEKDAASDDKIQGKYSFSENETRRLTAELNAELAEGEEPWTPHQVQAAIWTAVKTRYEIPEVKKLTNEKSAKQGLITQTGNTYSYDHMSAEQTRAHHANWRKFAMQPDSETVTELAKVAGRSFADEFERQTQIVTWEANPSTAFGFAINKASAERLREFTNRAAKIITDENGVDLLAKMVGVALSYLEKGSGAYQGTVSPNMLTQLLPARDEENNAISKNEVRLYARILQYVFMQDAVPFFRFENKPLSKTEIQKQKFRVIKPNGKTAKTFDTQAEAEEYVKTKGKEKDGIDKGFKVVGGNLAKAVVFKFKNDLSLTEKQAFLDKLEAVIGKDAGYTATAPNEITVINFRGDDDHLPFMMSDEAFEEAISSIDDDNVIDVRSMWAEGEYGYWHDWKADPTGKAILEKLGFEHGDIERAVSELEQDAGSGSAAEASGIDARTAEGRIDLKRLVRWRSEFEQLVREYEQDDALRGSGSLSREDGSVDSRLPRALTSEGLRTEVSFGEPTEGSIKVLGVHFSSGARTVLDTSFYGKGGGMKGAEKERLDGEKNGDIRPRSYFYVDSGNGVAPESGVGGNVHSVVLNNVYDADADQLGIVKAAREQAKADGFGANEGTIYNYVERAILNAGFDGYVRDFGGNQKAAVIIGPNKRIPVDYHGTHDKATNTAIPRDIQEAQSEEPEMFFRLDLKGIPEAIMAKLKDLAAIVGPSQFRIRSYGTIMSQRIENQVRKILPDLTDRITFQQRVWHGSPFDFDQFLLEKIGSGEGAQAHGWGLYFTKNRKYAEHYRDMLVESGLPLHEESFPVLYVDGRKVDPGTDVGYSGAVLTAFDFLARHRVEGKLTKRQKLVAIRVAKDFYEKNDLFFDESDREEIEAFEKNPDLFDVRIKNEKQLTTDGKSADRMLYEVEIPNNSYLLDEQKTLEQQSKTVRKGLEKLLGDDLDNTLTGKQIYETLTQKLGSPMEASLALLGVGIKGISYEGAIDGRSFVVFDDKAVSVIQKLKDDVLKQLAYHGSPYRFLNFDLSHIGEGEGAQVHGWGLYFALRRDVAEGYRERLSGPTQVAELLQTIEDSLRFETESGKSLTLGEYMEYLDAIKSIVDNDLADLEDFFEDATFPDGTYVYSETFASENPDILEDIEEGKALSLREVFEKFGDKKEQIRERYDLLERYQSDPVELIDNGWEDGEFSQDTVDWFNGLVGERIRSLDTNPEGAVYVVDIPNNDVMLDTEASILDQPPAVDEAMEAIFGRDEWIDMVNDGENITGEELYRMISDKLGGDKAASVALNEHGIKGLTYVGGIDGLCAVVFDDKAIQIMETYQAELAAHQHAKDLANEFGFRGAYSPSRNEIQLTPEADLSTFCHEMGHWYLQNLLELSVVDGVSDSIREDAATILKEFGLASYDAWQALPARDREVLHERFAFWTEEYLATGKAPHSKLQGLFDRLGKWIREVYVKLTNANVHDVLSGEFRERFGEDLPRLSDEVRRVLDRMVASDEMLDEALAAESLMPLFDEKPADMDDETWAELQLARDDAEAEGQAKYFEQLAKDEKWAVNARSRKLKEIQAEGREVRDKIKTEVTLEVNSMPVFAAIDIISAGNRAAVTMNIKMDPDALMEYSLNVNQMAKLRSMGLIKKGGVTPQVAFQQLKGIGVKFSNGKQMIKKILQAPDRKELIEKITTAKCIEQHSALFDPKKIDATVTKAIHNEARSRMIATELRYLTGDLKGRHRILVEAAKRVAKEHVGKMSVRQLSVKAMMAMESRASREAFRAVREGNRAKAVIAKRKQLVAHEMVREAMQFEKEMRKLKDIKSRAFSADKKMAKSRDISFVNLIRFILTNEGLGKKGIGEEPDLGQKFISKIEKYEPDTLAHYQQLLDRHPVRMDAKPADRTVDEIRGILGDVDALWKESRARRVVDLDGKTMDRDEIIEQLLDTDPAVGRTVVGVHRRLTPSQQAGLSLLSVKNALRRVENWCLIMDENQPNGPWTRFIFRPVRDAAAKFRAKNQDIQEKLANMVLARRDDWAKVHDIEFKMPWGYTYTFTDKAELIGALLHCGNESNKHKLLLGGRGSYGDTGGPNFPWCRVYTLGDKEVVDTSAWDEFIQKCADESIITREDMDFVQGVWDLLEGIKPLIQRAYKAQFGTYFQEVEAQSFSLWFNGVEVEYRGGYVPAKTDPNFVSEAKTQEEEMTMEQFDIFSAMPATRPGFTQSRVTAYNRPLALDFGHLAGHIETVLKYAYLANVCNDVKKIFLDRRVKDYLDWIDPTLINDLLTPWIKRAYEQTTAEPSASKAGKKVGKIAGHLRSLAGMGIMAGHIVNALQQITGFSIAIPKVGAMNLWNANGQVAKEGLTRTVEKISTMSPFMKTRFRDRAMEYESTIRRIASGKGVTYGEIKNSVDAWAYIYASGEVARDWAQRHAYILQTAMQIPVDSIVWTAAYNKAIARGDAQEDAIAWADSAVVTTQSSFNPEDIANIEAGHPLMKLFLVFYNYFGMQLNALGESWATAKATKKYGRFATDALFIVWIPSVVSELITRTLTGGFDTDDDDDVDFFDAINLFVGAPIQNLTAMIPLLGGVINSAGSAGAKAGIVPLQTIYGSDPYVGKIYSSPGLDLVASAGSSVLDIVRMVDDDNEANARQSVRHLLDLAAVVTGIPVNASIVKKPLGYTAGVMSGDIDEPDNALELTQGLVSGKGEK